jgi:hypothetical protein
VQAAVVVVQVGRLEEQQMFLAALVAQAVVVLVEVAQ